MNHDDPIIGKPPSLLRNGMGTMPSTLTARKNYAALLRASQDVGYSTVGRSIGRVKSWVSRIFTGESVINLPELLTWLDACDLTIAPSGGSKPDEELVRDLLDAISGVDSIQEAAKSLADSSSPVSQALLQLARRKLTELSEADRGG